MNFIELIAILAAAVNGTVTADGAPAANATVQFVSATRSVETTTAADGTFTADVEPGVYSITVERKQKKQIFTMTIPKVLVAADTVLYLSWPTGTTEERDAAIRSAFDNGSRQLSAGSYDQAIETFNDGLKWDSAQSGMWASLALAYTGKQDYKNAVYAGEMSIRYSPDNAGYRNNLGSILFRLGEYERAAARYKEAADLNSAGRGLYMSNLGACYVAMGQYSQAVNAYNLACTDANVPPSSWYYLGAMCEKTGDAAGALKAYQSYVTAQPNGTYAAQARARITALGG